MPAHPKADSKALALANAKCVDTSVGPRRERSKRSMVGSSSNTTRWVMLSRGIRYPDYIISMAGRTKTKVRTREKNQLNTCEA